MKGSVVGKMPGDYKNQLRCTRGFYAYLLAHPGKKLLFMGAELGPMARVELQPAAGLVPSGQ